MFYRWKDKQLMLKVKILIQKPKQIIISATKYKVKAPSSPQVTILASFKFHEKFNTAKPKAEKFSVWL